MFKTAGKMSVFRQFEEEEYFMPKLGLISLGCAKNLVDSEHMLSLMRDAGWEITEDMSEADVGVVNTCGFIEAAKKPSRPSSRPRSTSRPAA